jgi:hypothetical protein
MYALDRLSRKQTHQGLILSEAEHASVMWDSVTEDIDNSPQGQILRAVIGGMAEMERMKIAERTVRGRLARVHAGKLMPGSKPPYGYLWRDETKAALDLDPATAPVIRRVFERIAAGDTMHSVVRDLRQHNTPTATGRGIWHVATLRDIVIKPHYCGKAYAWGWKKRTPAQSRVCSPSRWLRHLRGLRANHVGAGAYEPTRRVCLRTGAEGWAVSGLQHRRLSGRSRHLGTSRSRLDATRDYPDRGSALALVRSHDA